MGASGFILGESVLRKLRGEHLRKPEPKQEPSARREARVRREARKHANYGTPKGIGHIYAVTVVDHPEAVKFGRAICWRSRRTEYASWNLRPGDAIASAWVFRIAGSRKLPEIEKAILQRCPAANYARNEWFRMDLSFARRHAEDVLCAFGVTYEVLTDEAARKRIPVGYTVGAQDA